MSEFWNKMYEGDKYIYGEKPNDFFAENISGLNPGKILLVGDGEGRNRCIFGYFLGFRKRILKIFGNIGFKYFK